MKAKELAAKLLEHPEFDVKFHSFQAEYEGSKLICISCDNIDICDIYSDKVIILSGKIE